ncbi:hypothetical protein DES49_0324 [Halospina denitrificans]|uniref:Spy/CpxP family protein refolding chaperone n=1 Tax=Halospina denitrificans TaxID=332522 RepID=A0A4R7K1J7_9GAMM|nr:hypothetical protein [Halospina denitrificans]TDT44224.1 hypothetical protein DES49_0324 [Halospina denitrificans]
MHNMRIIQLLALMIVLLMAAPAIASSHKDKEHKGGGHQMNPKAMCEQMKRMKAMHGGQSMGMGKDMMKERRKEMVERLDLTEEQQQELQAMHEEHREKMQKRMEKMKERCANMDN